MYSHLVISIDELWLKGKNQKLYLKAAIDHVNAVFKNYHSDGFKYNVHSQRLFYSSKSEFSEELLLALQKVPGLANISPCRMVPRSSNEDLENVYEAIVEEVASMKDLPATFRAMVKRNDQTFSVSSVTIAAEIGARVLKFFPHFKVDLKKGELVIDVRILSKHVSISTVTKKGIGGLPWGTTGKALTLLSGGFDSPVASYLMSKRGVAQSFVFFHAYPYVGREVLTKIKKLTTVLTQYQRQAHLYIVPFGEIQNQISKHCREEYRTIIFRKMMVELTNMIAERTHAEALITGDCIGQVSSQTMHNLHLMDRASKRMIIRPLMGHNKLEILSLAERIGTHDISIIPHDDACSLFAPKNPVITPSLDYWQSFEQEFSFQEEKERALQSIETYSVSLKGELFRKDFLSFDQ